MSILKRYTTSRAFALPTVLIASIVMLTILAVSVTATVAVRTTLKNQYYAQLAKIAGEAGVAYAKACLAVNGNVPLWTNAKPLTPSSDCSGNQILSPSVKALVVAGGGSGGGSTGGGGGAGGVLSINSSAVTASSYSIVVGAGGAIPGNQALGISGGNSSFNGSVAIGGGGGAYSSGAPSGAAGLSGGSGGGGENYWNSLAPGTGTAGQGNAGGSISSGGSSGGGGSAGVGLSGAAANLGGNGGPGAQYNISGSTVYYGPGGGGANGGIGGIGGGGNGADIGSNATANTGGGGGGGWSYASGNGGAGGSGIVIISYPVNSGMSTSASGTYTTSTSGGNMIYKFTGSGTFVVNSLGAASCPSDPRCSVTVNGNIRSSFSVPLPTLDSNGRALTIPNSGYVNVVRTSNGSIWRTYTQPSTQSAVVPDLCSGNATAARGWSGVVKTATQYSLSSASSAQTIALADGPLNAGQIFFRKDFNVSRSGTYELNILTTSAQNIGDTYIDSQYVSTATGSLSTTTTTLTPGCHVLVVRLTNATVIGNNANFTASLSLQGNTVPLVVSDTSWRVETGASKHFSETNYAETPGMWEPTNVLGVWNNTALPWGGTPTNWSSLSGDTVAMWLTTNYTVAGGGQPGSSYAWFRNTQPFTLASATNVRVTVYCDDQCGVYLDGQQIMAPPFASGIVSIQITIQPGTHTFGVRLFNGPGTGGNPAGLLFAATNTSDGTVLSRSDTGWDSTIAWSTTAAEPYSYDATFLPNPAYLPTTNVRTLAVGGGGGGGSDMGGGGGGAGVVERTAFTISPGAYPIVVGSGGSGAAAGIGSARGVNGGNSSFSTVRAYGGGGGGSEYSNNASPPGGGASAGGSAGAVQLSRAAPIISQGNGSAISAGSYYPTGGGGAGGGGSTNPATGGVGVTSTILGTSYYFGGGGGGSGYTSIGGNGGNGGGGGGAVGTTTGGSGINTGSAGGGGTTVSQTNTPGGNAGANTGGGGGGGSHYNSNNYGGNGGSGIVVITYPTGSLTATGGTISTTTIAGFTTHTFFSSGTFNVVNVNTAIAPRGVNTPMSFAQWSLSGSAVYNGVTGELTLGSTGVATSPLVRVDKASNMALGADFYTAMTSPNQTPKGGNHVSFNYFGSDGTTPVMNSINYTGNGCSQPLNLSVWTLADTRCGIPGGPNVIYMTFSLLGSSAGYASADLKTKNPFYILTN